MKVKSDDKHIIELLEKIRDDKKSRHSKEGKRLIGEAINEANETNSGWKLKQILSELTLRLLQIAVKVFDP